MGARLARALVQRSGGHSVFFRHVDHFTCQHVVGIGVRTLTVNYTEIVAHAHTVDTRPSLSSPSRRPGDEASGACVLESSSLVSHSQTLTLDDIVVLWR